MTGLLAGVVYIYLAVGAGSSLTILLVLLVGALTVATAVSAQRCPEIELHLSRWSLTALVIAFGVLALITTPKYSFSTCKDYSGRYEHVLEGATAPVVDGVREQEAVREPQPHPTPTPTSERAELDEPEERLPDCAVEFPRAIESSRDRAGHSDGVVMLGMSSLVAAGVLATRRFRVRQPSGGALLWMGVGLLLLNWLFLYVVGSWLHPDSGFGQ